MGVSIGDKVKISGGSPQINTFIGQVGLVEKIIEDSLFPYRVLIDGSLHRFTRREIEVIEENPNTTPEPLIKGDVVLIKPNSLGMSHWNNYFGVITYIADQAAYPYVVTVGDMCTGFTKGELTKVGHYDGDL